MMKHYKWIFLLLPVIVMALAGCSKKQEEKTGVEVAISWVQESDPPFHPLLLYTYGAKSIRVDTLMSSKKGVVTYSARVDRDTIDLMLLKNITGHMLLPIHPDQNQNISVKYDGDSLYLSGIKQPELIRRYYNLLETQHSDISDDMLFFFDEHVRESIMYLLILDLINRYPQSDCAEELRRIKSTTERNAREYMKILGTESSLIGSPVQYDFPRYLGISGEKESVELRKKMGKKGLMAVSVMDISRADSIEMARIGHYFSSLDSLKIPSFSILPLQDSLPIGWKVKNGADWRLFLVDSTGMATNFVQAYDLSMPLYLLVDSTSHIWRHWEEPDSLIRFLKSYEAAKKVQNRDSESN